jgi:TRAP-type C4-dicarboxylate transport system substrate-binding protein
MILGVLVTVVLVIVACQPTQQAPAKPAAQAPAAPAAPAAKPAEPAKPAAQPAKPAAEKPAAQPGAKKLRIATCAPDRPDGLSPSWAYKEFAERVQKRSNGQIETQVHWAGSLYCEVAALKAMLDGAIEAGTASVQNSGTFTKAFFVIDMPFLFQSVEEEQKVLIEGPYNKRLKDLVMRDQPNMMPLIFTLNEGLRDVQCTKQVMVPSDMRGLKIRTTETPTDVAIWKAFGAIATPIAWAETYTAGTQNLIQCVATTTGFWLISAKQYEWTRHITLIDYQTQIQQLSINKKWFDALSPELQKVITDVAAEVEKEAIAVDKQIVDKWVQWLKTEGKQQIYTPTPEQKQQWVERAKPVYDEFKDKIPAGLLEEMQNYLKSIR